MCDNCCCFSFLLLFTYTLLTPCQKLLGWWNHGRYDERSCGIRAYVEICLSNFGGSVKERDSLKELRLNENLLLKWILKKQNGLVKRDKSESRRSTEASCCENGNEHYVSKYMGNFFTNRGHVTFSRTS